MKQTNTIKNLNRPIICFGAGSGMIKFKNLFPLSHIAFLCDNDLKKENTYIGDFKVYSPEKLKEVNKDDYIIIITSDFEDEISLQLIDLGLIEFENFYKISWIKSFFKKEFEDGHYYSTIPDMNAIENGDIQVYSKNESFLGINLNLDLQNTLFKKFGESKEEFYSLLDSPNIRYKVINDFFPFQDAALLFSMLKNERPKKVIEVGSGFSSAVFLDTKDHLNLDTEFTFIEPFPNRLKSLLKKEDHDNIRIIEENVQNVHHSIFEELGNGDILFLDSSHVSKYESDVNYLIFEILPLLKKGVRIHFHDVFKDFDYPLKWLKKGIYWNEGYILRAFLQYNSIFEIEYFGDYINNLNSELVPHKTNSSLGGSGVSIWLRKVKD